MAIPDFQSLMLPVLNVLKDCRLYSTAQIEEILFKKLRLTESERNAVYENSSTKVFYNRISWAKTYLKKADLVSYPERGRVQILTKGLEILKDAPKRIDLAFLRCLGISESPIKNVEMQKGPETNICDVAPLTPDEMIKNGQATLMAHLDSDLLERILKKSSTFFEQIVVKLIFKLGYGGSEQDIIQSCGRSGDGGIDGIIKQDVLGLNKICIQAKRYAPENGVSRPELQKFLWVVHKNASKGIFIVTSYFTREAIEEARRQESVVLIDGKELTRLMIEHNFGVLIKETIEIKKIDEAFFSETD